MENAQRIYLINCKRLIEEKLAWPTKSKDWKQRDYLNLVSILESETGISLSLSTIKRIWKDSYNGTPHPSTLDALAKFLDYEDWLSFQADQQNQPPSLPTNKIFPFEVKRYVLPLLIFIIGLASYLIFLSGVDTQKKDINFQAEEVSFSASNSQANGVPNTVIFNYDITSLEADSFFIQQSWNPFNREKINKTDTVLTSIYYYPGVHSAKLIANESVVKETTLRINSNGWIATVDYGMENPIPSYINLKIENGKPKLQVTKDELLENNLDFNDRVNVSYFFVDNLGEISGDNFVLTINLKSDSIMNITCPQIWLMVLGSEETHSITFMDKGCVNKAYIKFGEEIISGKNNDLSGLGVNVYEDQEIEIQLKEKVGNIYLNGQHLLEASYKESIGELTGFRISFAGTGRVNALKLQNSKDGTLIHQY